jgi:hypothetical protein
MYVAILSFVKTFSASGFINHQGYVFSSREESGTSSEYHLFLTLTTLRGILQDLEDRNFTVNLLYCTYPDVPLALAAKRELNLRGELAYALIDFDRALLFPSDALISECRCPAWLATRGAIYIPWDTCQGEPTYNPFALDVGILGITFCHQFQVC